MNGHPLIVIGGLMIAAIIGIALLSKAIDQLYYQSNYIQGLTLLGFGIGLTAFTIFPAIKGMVHWRKNQLRGEKRGQHSYVIECERYDLILDKNHELNGQHPYQLIAYYDNPLTGITHAYRSPYIWRDPYDHLPQKLTIHLNPLNRKEYWIDLAFLPPHYF